MNKYILALLFMLLWIAFFDEVNLIEQQKRLSQLKSLEEKQKYYQQEIIQANFELTAIQESKEAIEKFAREKYLMKKPGEDIFIVTPKK